MIFVGEIMKYSDLLKSHLRYGTTVDDILLKNSYNYILENVVIAPWWGHEMFNNMDFDVEQINDRLFNFYSDDLSFSFLELRAIGAPVIMDSVLPLGVTKCKNLIFLGSAGSLDEKINIGDIVVPKYSVCGDGASRYLNKNLEDEFLKEEYPTESFTNNLIDILDKEEIKYHYVPNFSVDNIFAQFCHIDRILGLGCKTIEMETANLFKCNELLNINITSLFCISDNTILNKSLYSGRTEEENDYRHKVRYEIIPKLVVELFKSVD